MSYRKIFAPMLVILAVSALVLAEEAKNKPAQPAGAAPEMKLPPGWTDADMKACEAGDTPGKMHERLTSAAGTWAGKNTMWMYPGADPMTTECTMTVTPILDGRFVKVEHSGDMPGMGPFTGFAIY